MRAPFATLQDVRNLASEMPFDKRISAKTAYQQLCVTRDKFPDKPAVSYQITSGPKDKNIQMNWTEVTQKVTQCANFFRSIGVGENDVVAYLMPTTHETLFTLMGAMTAGIVAPINPTLEPEKISALLSELNAKVVVTIKSFPKTEVAQLTAQALKDAPTVETLVEVDLLPHLSGIKKLIVPMIRPKNPAEHSAKIVDFNEALEGQNADKLDFAESEDDRFCALFHTGGTTGLPKFAQHRASGLLYNGWLGNALLMDETDSMICPMPLFHVFAAYPAWASCLCSGTHFIMVTPAGYRGDGVFDNFWKLVERYKATFMITVPTAAAKLMQVPVGGSDISSLKNAFCGSAPLPVELFKRFQEVTGIEIVEGYGMTEATCLISCNPVDGERKIGSVGLPLPYTDVEILHFKSNDTVSKTCGVDEVGEICVSNPGVVVGNTYTDASKNKGLYAKKTFMRTGDLGRIDEDGYIWITGRAKDIIIRGGHNIDPATIEEALAEHPQVGFAGAIGQPDAHAGELPCAYVELIEGADVSVEDLIEFANERIHDPTAKPKYLEILDELPKTAVGKVFKPDLRKMAITRIYNQALVDAGISASVAEVIETKKRGLVAQIATDGAVDADALKGVLGGFIRPWDIV